MDAVELGESNVEEWNTTEIRFREFADLPADEIHSPEFRCHGIQWRVSFFPKGVDEDEDSGDDVYTAIYLDAISSDETVDVSSIGFTVVGPDGTFVEDEENERSTALFSLKGKKFEGGANCGKGCDKFLKRSILLKSLTDGALVILVRILLTSTTSSRSFVPKNPFSKNVANLFMDTETADVKFEVRAPKKENQKKRAKTATDFHAHRLILKSNAPMLAELCNAEGSEGTPRTVSIDDVDASIFRHLLLYVYGGEVDGNDLKARAREIIDAADKYGVVGLKLEAEACYVESLEIGIGNLMDHLLYADAKNCALLKEAIMDFVVAHDIEVLENLSFDDCPGSLTKDLLAAMARARNRDGKEGNAGDEFSTMKISNLRRRVHERGLGVDGSRETMVALLRENQMKSSGENSST